MDRRSGLALLALLCVAAIVLAVVALAPSGGGGGSASSTSDTTPANRQPATRSAPPTTATETRTAATPAPSDASQQPSGRTIPAQSKTQDFFVSPSGNIGCELDHNLAPDSGDRAYCQTFSPPRSVTMSSDGRLKTCSGHGCIGNGPENTYTLPYGSSTELGSFQCFSRTTGITCTAANGAGFEISRAGVRRIHR